MSVTKLSNVKERRPALTAKSQKRVEEVLAIAKQVFSEFGYEKTTTLEIAQRLGISEATVFTYFGSKRELCMKVISNWYGEISQELENDMPRIQGTRAQLAYIIHKHLNVLIRDGRGLCALVLAEGRSLDTEFSELLAQLQRRYTAPLMTVLAAAQASGEIRTDISLRRMRHMAYGSMEHILWECVISGRIPDLETAEREVTEMLWAAFSPPAPVVTALCQLQTDVKAALRRYEMAQSAVESQTKSRKKPTNHP